MGGRFFVVEGPDGVGKTTLAARLASRLGFVGCDVLEVREPGGTPVAEAARRIVLDPALDASPLAELFLILAARADLVRKVTRPALAEGKLVLCDRYELSTWAYQVEGRQLPEEAVLVANRLATGGLVPDLTLVLNAPISVLNERIAESGKAPDRIEMAGGDVRARVARAFGDKTRIARVFGDQGSSRIVHIDASGPEEDVELAAWDVVHEWLTDSNLIPAV